MTDTLPIAISSPLTSSQKTTLINLIRRAAKAEILPRFGSLSERDISTKTGRQDLVTEADTEAEKMLARGIQQRFPHALVVGEEAVHKNPDILQEIAEAELAFILDPIDGTYNFANRLALFGVIVAITRFGKPVLGILYDPIADDWIIADEATPTQLGTSVSTGRPIAVAEPRMIKDMAGYVHMFMMPKEKQTHVASLFPDFERILVLRSSCHEYRMLAQGRVDFCLSGAGHKPWDHAAGVLICQQAGGVSAMLDGRDYNAGITDGHILSAADQDSWNRLRDHFSVLLG